MKKIQLNGHRYKNRPISGYAIVDDWNFDFLNQWEWSIDKYNRAYRREHSKSKKSKIIFMHRLTNRTPKGFDTDHINGDTLDNREINLRTTTHSQNLWNSKKQKGGSSKYKGVHWNKKIKQWIVQIVHNYKVIYLGSFHDEKIAALRYNIEAKELFGKYANLNVINF